MQHYCIYQSCFIGYFHLPDWLPGDQIDIRLF